MENTVVIIGAGAAGLMAARTLAKAGKTVTVLEARGQIGGRINTISGSSLLSKAELGAEFIHGDLPVTLNLLKEAGISSQTVELQMWRYSDGMFYREEEQAEGWDEVMEKLGELKEDMPIAGFMQQNFGGEKYKEVTKSILQFVAGYDTADPVKASAFALRNEWRHEDDGDQHRLPGGYCEMINYLANDCKKHGAEIILNAVAKDIYWEAGNVRVKTIDGKDCYAAKLIVAMPLGVLQAGKSDEGAIRFHPPLPHHAKAIGQIGFGAIIKILLRFNSPFWEDSSYGGISDNAFLFTEEQIPTWWTQGPGNPLLTGWLGGGGAEALKDKSDEEILAIAVNALALVFRLNIEVLKSKLETWRVANWTDDPFTRGSYAYDMVDSQAARKVLNQPVENTLYFTGEYLYNGPAMGTVEAALDSGMKTAGLCKIK